MQGVKIVLGVFLLVESMIDIKSKKVWLWMPFLAGTVGLGYRILNGYTNIPEVGGSLAVFILLIGISRITKESLGMGDVWVIASILMAIGLMEGIKSIFIGFLLAGIYGGILIVVKKCGGKTRIPFIPFLFVCKKRRGA